MQTNIEPIKNWSQETTVQTEKTQSSEQQMQPIKEQEQNIETATITPATTPSETVQTQQETPKAPQVTILTPTEENNKEKPKKIGFFSKLFKKSKKEDSVDNNEIRTNVPSLHPNDIETEYNRANINYKNKKYDAALDDDLSKIFSKDSAYVKGYFLRADIYAERGDLGKALEDLNKVIELLPQAFLAFFRRAEIYSLQNNDDAAFSDFGKTIELNQKFGAGYAGIAKIYAKRKDKEKAIENYNLAKKYDLKYSKIADDEIKSLSTSSS